MKIVIEVNEETKKLSIQVSPPNSPAVDVITICKIIEASTTKLVAENPHIHKKNIKSFPFDRLIKESQNETT